MTRPKDRFSLGDHLTRADYDQLAIELAASLKLYLQLLELDPFSPEITRMMSNLAREIVASTPKQRQLQ